MKTTFSIQQIEQRIQQIKNQLVALGDMRPGSLSKQFNVCGKPGCRCKVRIPAKADTCSNPKRTPIPIDIGQLSERSDALGLVINKCPI
jgi:hypothetical protein